MVIIDVFSMSIKVSMLRFIVLDNDVLRFLYGIYSLWPVLNIPTNSVVM